jgi:hypothetical protein
MAIRFLMKVMIEAGTKVAYAGASPLFRLSSKERYGRI